MPVLSDTEVLELWERGEGLLPAERAVTLALAVADGASPAEVSSLPLGRRDRLLVDLQRWLAGPALEATAVCPLCDEVVELVVDLDELALMAPAEPPAPGPLVVDGWTLTWRPVTSVDLAAAATAEDAAEAERRLLEACVRSVRGPDGEREVTALPEPVRAELASVMEGADPLAEVLVDLACASCDHSFSVDVDLSRFVWAELRERAVGLLHQVDGLARAYGWTEAEVLALSADRRAAYTRLVQDGALSDLLSRLAARAVGAQQGAGARPPASEALGAPGDGGLEPAPDGLEPRSTAGTPVPGDPPASPSVSRARPSAAASPGPRPAPEREPAVAAHAALLERAAEGAADLVPAGRPAAQRGDRPVAPAPVPARPARLVERRIETIVAAAPRPTASATRSEPGRAPATAATAAPEEPPVQIHIGRLDVRANLQPAPAGPPPAPRTPVTPELSLTDYLRGERRTR